MAIEPRKQQKKVERRKAKEKDRRKALAQRNPHDLVVRIERSAAAPILHCCTTNMLEDEGMSNVLVSRELKSGNVAFVIFLVDAYCLGVKDVAFNVVPRARYDTDVLGKLFRDYRIVKLTPEATRKLVEGAVEYANELGLSPHHDYFQAQRIFGDIDASDCFDEFVYGKNGKPYFVRGPHDSPGRCSEIVSILTDHCGPEGFDYLLLIRGPVDARALAIDE